MSGKDLKEILKRTLAASLALCLGAALWGCGSGSVSSSTKGQDEALNYEDAVKELGVFVKDIGPSQRQARLDVNLTDISVAASLADIDTFPVTVRGNGQIDIEIAGATEMTAESAPDNWLNQVAERFNREGFTLDGKTVSATVRKITSGEVVTYMVDGGYRPDVYIPSNEAWGVMLEAKGFSPIRIAERLAGNTAGILMKKSTYNDFIAAYKECTVKTVLEASNKGDLVFAYTNPYTSSTGLNILTAMLASFDSENPLSDKAVSELVSYQKDAPTAAYTTSVLKQSAAKGIIDAMVMEEQAYINTPELRDYIYTPAGIRHDHPCYTFDYVPEDYQEAARLFSDFCQNEENQKLADKLGFNLHDDYRSQDSGLDGAGYLSAQGVWKQNKNGGIPVTAVFIADVSGSMNGSRLNALKRSLLSSMQYIDSSNYIGLVSYDDDVYINLPIGQFDDRQRAYFSGAVKDLKAGGDTATYDAVLVGLQMLLDYSSELPESKQMLFVLSDGAQNTGYKLSRVTPIVGGLSIPVYTIGYEMDSGDKKSLQELSAINEAACIDADVEGIVNDLRNLFNVNM